MSSLLFCAGVALKAIGFVLALYGLDLAYQLLGHAAFILVVLAFAVLSRQRATAP